MTTTTARQLRTAHPYDDTDVIDARAPRFNQAVIGLVSLVAVVTGWWLLLALLALQLALGLRFGRRWCLPCVAYFELVQPRIGEGRVEDARPPRFANLVGVVFLTAASVAYLAGLPVAGAVLGGTVAALALLSAVTGFCTGCEAYKLLTRLRGVRAGAVGAIDLADLGATATAGEVVVVQFTHPLCSDCHELERRLAAGPRPLHTVDVSRRPDLARRYHVAVVPTAFAVAGDGTVLERLA
jgi:thiol-disulfide isomerase/thioredoxin